MINLITTLKMQFVKVTKSLPLQFLIVFLVGITVLYPTFDLALTGDDYLGYWRMARTLGETSTFHDYLKYFLTDYGPQDTLTYIIHKFFGFNPTYYYVIAFVLRFVASLSFYPIVSRLTRNKLSAFISTLFFMISATGMEVLDWSFNMPSYIGIVFMNLSFYYLLFYVENKSIRNIFVSLALFLISIISQPIRLIILPLIFAILLAYLTVTYKVIRVRLVLFTVLYITSFYFLYSFSNYGAVGEVAKSSTSNKNYFQIFTDIYSKIHDKTQITGPEILLSPIGQIGSIVFPSSEISEKLNALKNNSLGNLTFFIFLSALAFIVYLSHFFRLDRKTTLFYTILIIIWFLVVHKVLLPKTGVSFHPPTLISYLIGGMFLIFSAVIYVSTKNKLLRIALIASLAIMVLSFLPPWFRTPGNIEGSRSRYLIVSAAGLALYIGTISTVFINNKLVKIFLIFLFIANIFSTTKFIHHLHASRNIKLANDLRNSIGYDARVGNTNEPFVYYFEVDNEDIFYHSLYFGFPFFLNYYKSEMKNPWLIMYTTNWNEVIEAYQTGKSLKRFMSVKIRSVDISNIFSYKLNNGIVTNTTQEIRRRLMQLDEAEKINSH